MLSATQSRNTGCSNLWKQLTTAVQTAAANNKLSITLSPGLFEKHVDCEHLSKMETLGYQVVFTEKKVTERCTNGLTTVWVSNTAKIGWGTKAPKKRTFPRWWHFWRSKPYATSYIFDD